MHDIFVIGCWPNSQEQMNTLVETIEQVKELGYPVLIVSNYPLPPAVIEMADYYIFDKRNIKSEKCKPDHSDIDQREENHDEKVGKLRDHAVACLIAIRDSIDFCRGKYCWLHYMEFDVEVHLDEWLRKVCESGKDLVYMDHPGGRGFRMDLFSGKVDVLDRIIPYVNLWDECKASGYPCYLETRIQKRIEDSLCMEEVALVSCHASKRFDQIDQECWEDDAFNYHFVDGPILNITGLSRRVYDVIFSNPQDSEPYRLQQKVGTWGKPAVKYFRDWTITARLDGEIKFQTRIDLKGKRVFIGMGSKALGDTVGWMPYIEEFRKKHECHVVCATWWNRIFDYPEIEFVEPGVGVKNLYASYNIGCYLNDRHRNPVDWRTIPLQRVASDILGLEYHSIRPKLKQVPKRTALGKNPYVCFSEYSTMHPKLWNNPGGWQQIVDYLHQRGFDVVSISKEESELCHVIKHNGQSIDDTIADLQDCAFYIGLSHGPSWLAWACGVPVILISGFTEPWEEFTTPYRIINDNVCHGCFNDISVKYDRGWEWCERAEFRGRAVEKYECTKKITPEMVKEVIDQHCRCHC